jgi:hypothetical protein
MKGKGKGIAASALPYKRKAPKWVTLTPSAVSDIITKLAKKGSPVNFRSLPLPDRRPPQGPTRNPPSQIHHRKENSQSFKKKWYLSFKYINI